MTEKLIEKLAGLLQQQHDQMEEQRREGVRREEKMQGLLEQALAIKPEGGQPGNKITSNACDNITNYQKCSNIGPFTNLILNFCTVIIFYAYVIIKMILMRVRQPFRDRNDEAFKSISLTMLLLTLVYLAFLLPIATCETCSPGSDLLETTQERAILANW